MREAGDPRHQAALAGITEANVQQWLNQLSEAAGGASRTPSFANAHPHVHVENHNVFPCASPCASPCAYAKSQ